MIKLSPKQDEVQKEASCRREKGGGKRKMVREACVNQARGDKIRRAELPGHGV